MFTSLPARWLAALPALAALTALAQGAPPSAAPSAEPTTPLSFRSAMDGYKPFAEEKAIPWKQANETVRQRGGWRAYAREVSEGAKDAPAAVPRKEKP